MRPMPLRFEAVKLSPAPRFSFGVDQPSLATIYQSQYDRMQAVIAAARTGNARLIRLSLAEHDRFGYSEEDA